MSRMGSVSPGEMADLADRLGLALAETEATGATERIGALSGLYEALTGHEPPESGGGEDRFEPGRYRPGGDADPHNAWLARFDLWRDATGVLDGLAVAVKDNICVRGVELTNGSRAFEGCVPRSHATVVERLLEAGGRIVGKTNMDELAFGPTSETSAFGPTENPVVPGHVAGGSSSGSAAAVADGEADLALGSDTGGSVRIPASYCGIVGIKPTHGRVPTDGFAHLAPSLDTIGTLARDVETAARGLGVIDGTGPADEPGVDPAALAVGVPERFFTEYVSEATEHAVRDAVAAFGNGGADVREVSIPALERSREAWWGIAPAEFAAEYVTDGCGAGRRGRVEPSLAAAVRRVRRASSRDLGARAKEMLLLGAHLLETHGGAHYVRATNWRARLRSAFDDALAGVDVLAAPATPTPALEIGGFERGVTPPVNVSTNPANLAGHPAVSVPCGTDGDGRPIGLQLIGPWGGEGTLVDAAAAYERELAPT